MGPIQSELDRLYTALRLDSLKLHGLLDDGDVKAAQKLAGKMIPQIEEMLILLREMQSEIV